MEDLTKLKIVYFFRKKLSQFNSIEELFDAIEKNIVKYGVEIQRVEMPSERANLKGIISNLKLTIKNRGKVNHITGHVNYLSLVTGRKTILTIHDTGSALDGSFLKVIFKKIVWFWLPALFVTKITVISEFSKIELLKIIPFAKKKISIINNPVKDTLNYTPKKFNKKEPIILHIGTKSNKNLERTIRAIKNIPCQLLIIGKLTQDQLTLLKEYKINYKSKCFIPYDEIIDAYIACDMVSFVSTYEGFGMPIVEAQAIGRPIVTSNICSMPEVANDAAILVNPFNIEEITNGILKIINNDVFREKLIKKGLLNVNRFKLNEISNQYMNLYKELNNRV